MKTRSIVSLLLAALMVVTLFTGCNPAVKQPAEEQPVKSPETPPSSSSDTPAAVPDASANAMDEKGADLRFVWWGGDARHKATLEAIDLYKEVKPDVHIEGEYVAWDGYYQKLVTQLASGAAADIMQISTEWFYDLSSQGELFMDLNQSEIIDRSIFDPAFLKSACEYNGVLMGLPTGVMADTIVFNKEFFERNNIPLDTEWTWDSLIEIGSKIHEADASQYLMIATPITMLYYLRQASNGTEAKDDFTPGFTEQMAVDAFTLLRKMYDTGTLLDAEDVVTVQQRDEHMKWQQGQTGLMFVATSQISKVASNSPFEIGVARYPVLEGSTNTGIQVKPSQLFSINTKTQYPIAAQNFLNWLYNDEKAILALKDSRGVPATDKAMKLLGENNLISPQITDATNIAMEWAGTPTNPISQNAELYNIMEECCDKVGFGKASPEEAAQELMQRYSAKLAELKGKS